MKNYVSEVVLCIFVGLLASCGTTGTTGPKPLASNENVLGTVQATFEAMQGYGGDPKEKNELAYVALLEAAQKEYQGNIDIRDVTWRQSKHVSGVPTAVFAVFEYNAVGKVISIDTAARTQETAVEGAIARASEQALKNIPQKSKIAIVYITAEDQKYVDFIAGELEFIWVNAGYFITDRSQLDKLRAEQNFGMSGEVDDSTAVSIGKFAGADVIVTGIIDGEGNLRRLRLRALNTATAQVVGAASERL